MSLRTTAVLAVFAVIVLVVACTTGYTAEEREQGLHCLEGKDRSHSGLVSTVKGGLGDPESFEHVESAIALYNPAAVEPYPDVGLAPSSSAGFDEWLAKSKANNAALSWMNDEMDEDQFHVIIMDYRARNSFNALVIGQVRASFNVEDCTVGKVMPEFG